MFRVHREWGMSDGSGGEGSVVSYEMIVAKLTKKVRAGVGLMREWIVVFGRDINYY